MTLVPFKEVARIAGVSLCTVERRIKKYNIIIRNGSLNENSGGHLRAIDSKDIQIIRENPSPRKPRAKKKDKADNGDNYARRFAKKPPPSTNRENGRYHSIC